MATSANYFLWPTKKATNLSKKTERGKRDCRESGKGRGSSRGGRVNDFATCFSLAASMMMADYRLHRVPTTGYPCPLPLASLTCCRLSSAVLAFPLPSGPLRACSHCSHKRLQLHANKPSVFVSAFVSVSVSSLEAEQPAKWRLTELALPSVKRGS